MNTPDQILASAMEKLADDIISDDGVASAAIREAGQRITELSDTSDRMRASIGAACHFWDEEKARRESFEKALAALMPFVLEDYYPGMTTRAFREAVENACALLGIKPETGGGDS